VPNLYNLLERHSGNLPLLAHGHQPWLTSRQVAGSRSPLALSIQPKTPHSSVLLPSKLVNGARSSVSTGKAHTQTQRLRAGARQPTTTLHLKVLRHLGPPLSCRQPLPRLLPQLGPPLSRRQPLPRLLPQLGSPLPPRQPLPRPQCHLATAQLPQPT